ncbi:hypothetical protein DSM112329_02869 [Paraconexibacter sp. AEG42_29]|uniref:Uncharacterized protein n=1 Tax=Paraconexibacter sp. AEG42_29 TaxID=2997339 RepID=A0AAU7AWI2_9ACTN
MAHATETEDKQREKLSARVGRPVETVASVRPAVGGGKVYLAGLAGELSPAPIVATFAAMSAMQRMQERRRAQETGLATRMTLAVTEHDVHLFRVRAMGQMVGDHVLTVPYGMVAGVAVGRTKGSRIVGEMGWDGSRGLVVNVTIALTDGSQIKLVSRASESQAFEQLRGRAYAVPAGTVPPPPARRPEPSVARLVASGAARVAQGAVSAVGHARAAHGSAR